jgi:hypothetical protein
MNKERATRCRPVKPLEGVPLMTAITEMTNVELAAKLDHAHARETRALENLYALAHLMEGLEEIQARLGGGHPVVVRYEQALMYATKFRVEAVIRRGVEPKTHCLQMAAVLRTLPVDRTGRTTLEYRVVQADDFDAERKTTKRKRVTYAELTDDQNRALTQFIIGAGRYWKSDLRRYWETGSNRISAELHQIRNSHGPKWLKSYIHG